MNYNTEYEELKNIISSELKNRCYSDEYTVEYKRECAGILVERGDMSEEEFDQLIKETVDNYQSQQKITVPKSLEECYKSDSVSDAIWNFGKRVERAGVILLVIIILGGLVLSFYNGYAMKEVSGEDFDSVAFFASLAVWGMYAFIEYWIFELVSKLLTGFASIVQSNKITANVALYNAKDKE